jgi:hypothetical protein
MAGHSLGWVGSWVVLCPKGVDLAPRLEGVVWWARLEEVSRLARPEVVTGGSS